MTNAGRKATAVLLAAIAMMAAGRASAHDDREGQMLFNEEQARLIRPRARLVVPLTIRIFVMNDATVPHDVLARAQAEATRIYAFAGVDLMWTEDGRAERRFTVKITSRSLGGRRIDNHSIGGAPGTELERGVTAYAYFIPIERLARAAGIDAAKILGHVIAHELGHLLLPHGTHTMSGVMGGGWDRAQVEGARKGELTFTQDEGKIIRERLLTLEVGR